MSGSKNNRSKGMPPTYGERFRSNFFQRLGYEGILTNEHLRESFKKVYDDIYMPWQNK